MKEYIEKETARAELIINDELYAADIVKAIPAADVRPVVTCADCKHGQGKKMDFWNEYEGIECVGGVVHRKDWFCADGERKGGDE